MLALQSISLTQFRNYPQAFFTFSERIIGISGANGKGKTNLLDAIYYLCFTKSYFTRSDLPSVEHGKMGFRIEGNFTRNGEPEKVVCVLRETGKKEFMLNDQPYERFAQHIGQFPCVIIAPDDVHLITGGSEERRRFIDTILSQLDTVYLQQLIDYNRILQQRNSYLKSLSDSRDHDKNLLAVYDEQLIAHGSYIHDKRTIFLSQLIPLVLKFYEQIAEKNEGVDLNYETQLSRSSFQELLLGYRQKDMLLQRTNGGIHKDDIIIKLNQQLFRSEASQGQRKSLLFALKLAEFDILRSSKGFAPILMLDDVFEKLDEKRMHNLLQWVCVQNEGQIFITDTHAERIRTHLDRLEVKYQLMGI